MKSIRQAIDIRMILPVFGLLPLPLILPVAPAEEWLLTYHILLSLTLIWLPLLQFHPQDHLRVLLPENPRWQFLERIATGWMAIFLILGLQNQWLVLYPIHLRLLMAQWMLFSLIYTGLAYCIQTRGRRLFIVILALGLGVTGLQTLQYLLYQPWATYG